MVSGTSGAARSRPPTGLSRSFRTAPQPGSPHGSEPTHISLRGTPMRIHLLLGAALLSGAVLSACSDSNMPTQPAAGARPALASHNAVDGADFGFTAGWLDGRTVQFFYHKNFFCRTPVEDGLPVGSTSGCESGSDGTVDPRPGNIPELYVMTPLGFRPDESTLH